MLACVTGGTGFVGSFVVRALLEDGHRVRVLHRQSSKLNALQGLDYESVIGDITDVESLLSAFRGCDWVFHVAAVADYWRADNDWLYEVNVEGTRKVLEAAQQTDVKRVVFTSSAAAIGLPKDASTPSDESVAFNLPPEDFYYGYSKALAEAVVQEFVAQGLDVVIVNPTVVIGAGDLNMISGTYITQVAQWQWLVPKTAGGIAVTDVRDVAQGHLSAVKKGKTGERYILNTANYSNDEWFSLIAECVGVAPPLLPTPNRLIPIVAKIIERLRSLGIKTPVNADQVRLGAKFVHFDASRSYRELYQPQIDMRQSVQETVAWYRHMGIIGDGLRFRLLQRIGRLWHRR